MLKIGLTGGIGSGKSTVANLFLQHNVAIIDADHISHQLTRPKQPALTKINAYFGDQIIDSTGALKRDQLKQIIFYNPIHKKHLESILHPLIFTEMARQIKMLNTLYVILCIPLLLETKRNNFVDRILLVDCPFAIQFQRIKSRDLATDTNIKTIIGSQTSRAEKRKIADDIIANGGNTMQLAKQVKKMHNLYLCLANQQKESIASE